ncbi:hypothetical protein [Rhodococcus globerulus]|uniref:hypothetical protein n=1 Tax=Rhodococcus globerulus TaxID=33008 RepID=UPI001FD015AD|nr:hypothetical protein [Rhodococcus globerulus]
MKGTNIYEVKATHLTKVRRQLACEIYPKVFVVDGGAVISTYAGPANGHCPCDPLSPDADTTFEIDEDQLTSAANWATSIYRPRSW